MAEQTGDGAAVIPPASVTSPGAEFTAVYVIGPDGSVTFSSDVCGLLVAAGTQTVGRPFPSLEPLLDDDGRGPLLHAAGDQDASTSAQWWSPRLETWLELTSHPSDAGVALHLRDLQSEHATRDRVTGIERRLRRKAALLDIARDAIFVQELDHTVTYWNRAAEDLYGWPARDMLGSSVRTVMHTDPVGYDAAIAQLLRTGRWSGELEQVARDGRTIIGDCRWQLASAEGDGRPAFILCVVSDITGQRHDEEETYRTQRTDSLGTLAGGIAHDLNNVLTPILISSQLLLLEEEDEGRVELLRFIETSAERGSDMIQQVLTFVRGEESKRTLLDLRVSVDQLLAFCRETIPPSIQVEASAAPDLWPVLGDSTQILQILVNLVTNARDAMPNGGRITVGARNRPAGPDQAGPPTDLVVLEVEDTGHGMEAEVAERVFEPFFTTKETGRGTGLGLSTSMTIAQSHGGRMTVTSTPGSGSVFRLLLPAVVAHSELLRAEAEPVTTPGKPHQGSGELVLVVDDETTIRTIVKHALESQGYTTLVAGDGVEAIMVLENSEEPVDAVFTDMMMPIMDGAALATYLFEHHPGIALVASSGVSQKGDDVRAAHAGVEHFLPKPFSTDALLDALRDALAERRRPRT